MRKVVPPRFDALSTHHNRWGFRGVERIRNRFRAVLGNKVWRSSYFETPREAAEAYDAEARRRYGECACLNCPRPGERGVKPMDADVCLRGHDRARFTYFHNGRPSYCRLCNKLAQQRAAARRAARG